MKVNMEVKMQNIYISNILINKVRHLENIDIPMSTKGMKHLILTGKNGSGKTSLLNAMAIFLESITCFDELPSAMCSLEKEREKLQKVIGNSEAEYRVKEIKERIRKYEKQINLSAGGVWLELNRQLADVQSLFLEGKFVVAYYKAEREFKTQVPKHVEKVQLGKYYSIDDEPRNQFIKYLLDLKVTEALAKANGKEEKATRIAEWFEALQNLLKDIFEDDSVHLVFEEDSFKFTIHMNGREPFEFNTLSSGFSAIMEIVIDIMFRMEKHTNKVFDYSLPGIVLIDEIETHLHLELQKKVMKLLTTLFPNIQFIVTTHSPFILNSFENAIIFDLENNLFVKEGLTDIPYAGIVEGYFKADTLSKSLRTKYDRYKELVYKPVLSDADMDEIADLEMYLNEIPDYLALDITTEYQRLKLELRAREDI